MKRSTQFLGRAFTVAALVLATGCAVKPFDLDSASAKSQLNPVAVKGSEFTIQTLQPKSFTGTTLRVYIEGDGRAWITSRTVSDDPTPIKSIVPTLALSDPAPAVYMARPCQFVMTANCSQSLWTTERFSRKVIQAHSETLDTLKSKYGVQAFELVGYSGGGAVALLLAASRNDVAQVQTIAGNIDTQAWTSLKELAPLTGSLNPADFTDRLAELPQRHLIGLNDTVVPPEVGHAYMLKVQPRCGETVFVDATHHAGFEPSWNIYRFKPIECAR